MDYKSYIIFSLIADNFWFILFIVVMAIDKRSRFAASCIAGCKFIQMIDMKMIPSIFLGFLCFVLILLSYTFTEKDWSGKYKNKFKWKSRYILHHATDNDENNDGNA